MTVVDLGPSTTYRRDCPQTLPSARIAAPTPGALEMPERTHHHSCGRGEVIAAFGGGVAVAQSEPSLIVAPPVACDTSYASSTALSCLDGEARMESSSGSIDGSADMNSRDGLRCPSIRSNLSSVESSAETKN